MDRYKRDEFDNCLILDTTFFAFNNESHSLRQRFIQFINNLVFPTPTQYIF